MIKQLPAEERYLIIGGDMVSKSDGDEHYISPQQLVKLYGLKFNPNTMFLFHDESDGALRSLDKSKFIVLGPRYNGNYDLTPPQSKETVLPKEDTEHD